MAENTPSETRIPHLGCGIATLWSIGLIVPLLTQIGWRVGEKLGWAQGSWVGFWIGLIASFLLVAVTFKLLRRRNPRFWSAALSGSTRPIISVLTYPPTRSYPFGMVILGGVWLAGSFAEYFRTIPKLERRVGALTGPEEMTLLQFLDAHEEIEYVKLTDFTWCHKYGSYVPVKSRHRIFCIPIVPRDDAVGSEQKQKSVYMVVIIYGEYDDLPRIRKLTEVQGLIDDLHIQDHRVVEQILAAYPGTDANRCRVLRQGSRRGPVTAEDVSARKTQAYFHLALSSVLTVVGLLLFIRHHRQCSKVRYATPSSSPT